MALQQKQYPLAIQYLNNGLKVDAGNLTLLEDLAETYYLSGNGQQAASIAQQVLQRQPNSARAQQVLSLLTQ